MKIISVVIFGSNIGNVFKLIDFRYRQNEAFNLVPTFELLQGVFTRMWVEYGITFDMDIWEL